jgi:hypothetical protein
MLREISVARRLEVEENINAEGFTHRSSLAKNSRLNSICSGPDSCTRSAPVAAA